MKGFCHFVTGIAAASAFPEAVKTAASGDPCPFIVAGIAALLPDTIDFKILRFIKTYDIQVIPDPLSPDPAIIADARIILKKV